MIPTKKFPILSVVLVLFSESAFADTFGSGIHRFDIDFVTVGNPGNAADRTGYGAVDGTYRMGKHEVSRGMINSYNALRGSSPAITMENMEFYGANGLSRPATGVSWNEAARFVNWLNTNQGYEVAYQFTTTGRNDNITLWTAGDAGFDPANPFRNRNAHYFLPSEDEWYKAAYYDPEGFGGSGRYQAYATGRFFPTAVAGGTTADTAVYLRQTGPADVTNAGGLSPYGTMAQSGNVTEWMESGYDGLNNTAGEARAVRGGNWVTTEGFLASSYRDDYTPATETLWGVRVASIPEPSSAVLLIAGLSGLAFRRRR